MGFLNYLCNIAAATVLVCLFIDHSPFNGSNVKPTDPLIFIVGLLAALVLKTNNREKS